METNQTGVKLLQGNDDLVMDRLEETYGYTGILQYLQDSLSHDKELAHLDGDVSRRDYSQMENKVRRLILEFQKTGIE